MTIKQEDDSFDPLAWMNDDEVVVEESKNKSESEVIAEDRNETEDVLVDAALSVDDVTEVEAEGSIEPVIQDAESVEGSKITLNATLNIQNVTALYEQFLKLLDTQNKIEIDASTVVSIDTATLQLLTVLKQTGINLQKEIIIDFPSDEFIESAEVLGVSELLDVNQAAAGFF